MSPKCEYGPDCKGQEMDLQGRFEAGTVQAARDGRHAHRVYVCYQCGTVAVERSADNAGITWVYPDGNGATLPDQEPDKDGNKIGTLVLALPAAYIDALRDGSVKGGVSVRACTERSAEDGSVIAATETQSAMLCAHANENPGRCNCPDDCYCKTHTCKDRPKPLTPVELEARLSQTLQDLLVAALEQRRDVARYLCVTGQSSSFLRKTEKGWLTVEARLAPLEDEDKGDQ